MNDREHKPNGTDKNPYGNNCQYEELQCSD